MGTPSSSHLGPGEQGLSSAAAQPEQSWGLALNLLGLRADSRPAPVPKRARGKGTAAPGLWLALAH